MSKKYYIVNNEPIATITFDSEPYITFKNESNKITLDNLDEYIEGILSYIQHNPDNGYTIFVYFFSKLLHYMYDKNDNDLPYQILQRIYEEIRSRIEIVQQENE